MRLWFTALLALGLLLPFNPVSGEPRPVVAIVIDDFGYDPRESRRAAALPGPIHFAVLPHTPFARMSSELAIARGHEVLLHLPMEAKNGSDPGPGAILGRLSEEETRQAVRDALESVPHAKGMNNHMGSLLSREHHHLAWVMSELREHHPELYVLDSRTHPESQVRHIASWAGLPATQRDVFLDAEPHNEDFVRQQMALLERIAHRDGMAVGIGHPYPETLRVLEEILPDLKERGIRLIKLSDYLAGVTLP